MWKSHSFPRLHDHWRFDPDFAQFATPKNKEASEVMGIPQKWIVMENPIDMDDLGIFGVPPF